MGSARLTGPLVSLTLLAGVSPALASPPTAPPEGLADTVAKMSRAVVNVSTRRFVARAQRREAASEGRGVDGFFDHFFGGGGGAGNGELRRSLGSGIVIDPAGYVLTNDHVIGDATEIRVTLSDERTFPARVVGRDSHTDVALLKIPAANLPSAPLGDSDQLRVGDAVVAIGNPFGLSHTVTTGIVSAKGRVLGEGPYDDFIQTDASINPGNSGGPLFDLAGHVVGVNTAIVDGARGIGFAIPVSLVKNVLPQLRERGRVVRGFLGVGVQHVTPSLARAFELSQVEGALVSQVDAAGPAAAAGLRVGDVISAVNGRKVRSSDRLAEIIAENAPGTRVTLDAVRTGARLQLLARVAALPDDDDKQRVAGRDGDGPVHRPPSIGIAVRPLSPVEQKRIGESGVLVERVDPDGAAAGNLEAGDVIVEVDRRPLRTTEELVRAAIAPHHKRGRPLLLRVRRGEGSLFVTVDGDEAVE